MSRLHGKTGQVSIVATGGSPGEIIGVTSWSLDIKGSADDATSMDSNCVKEFISGLTEWSGSVSAVWDTTEADLTADVPPLISAGISIDMELYVNDTSPEPYTGTAIVTGFKPEVTIDGAVKWSMDFQGTDDLTYPTTPA